MPPSIRDRVLSERIQAYQKREFNLLAALNDEFMRPFESFQEELDRHFLQYFVTPWPKDTEEKPPTWRRNAAVRHGSLQTLNRAYQEQIEAAGREAAEELEDALVDAYTDGYEWALWALFLAGEDTLDAADLDDTDIVGALEAGAIGGLTARDRLGAWIGVSEQQLASILGTGIAAEQTYQQTVGAVQRLTKSLASSIAALASNELFLAGVLGAAFASRQLGAVEVWVTADDEKVCPICRPKHLTVTNEQPIVDSHPACRCEKLPWALVHGRSRPFVSFQSFQARRP